MRHSPLARLTRLMAITAGSALVYLTVVMAVYGAAVLIGLV